MRESVKHRLIGAAVLTAVAVLFLPSFFKDRQQHQVDTRSQIPSRPSITAVDFSEPTRPDGIEPALAPDAMFVPDPDDLHVDGPGAQPLESSRSDPEPVVAATSQPAASSVATSSVAAKVPELPLNARGLPDAWVIQVASLSSQAAAYKLRDQLQGEGHKAYVRSVPAANGHSYRVFIGPRQDKAELQTIKVELDKRLKVNSLLLPFKP